MDRSLHKVVVSSIEKVDQALDEYDPEKVQLHVDETTTLVHALGINARMQAGIRGADAFQVFNPELVARKVEAEAAMRAAIALINTSIGDVEAQIVETQELQVSLQRLLAQGRDAVYVGPSINRRAVDRDQVVFPTNSIMPDEGIAPARKMSITNKVRSRGFDARSQVAFWDLNLKLLLRKEVALTAYRDALVEARDEFSQAALHQPTALGCGYSDFGLRF